MATRLQGIWQGVRRTRSREAALVSQSDAEPATTIVPPVVIAPGDPILLYFQSAPGVVDVETLKLNSPGLLALREAGVKLVLPLVSQGELIGLVNLGPRLSDQDYSSDDRRLLNDLVTQASPAVRVAQLVRQQEAEARDRERMEQELRVARLIQQTLLPKELPSLPGWTMAAHYQPARAVGGDFYDFLTLPDGKLGLVIGDVTDKGVPAALVMATTRAILRGASRSATGPGEMLRQTNELLHPDIPDKMFVTCLYAILEPATGVLRYANAGHDLPYRRSEDGVTELRARGMPLGLMSGMHYEEQVVVLQPGDSVLFYSDGLVEAHDPQFQMFGFPRLQQRLAALPQDEEIIPFLLNELVSWTGETWEQEDDVTLVVLARDPARVVSVPAPAPSLLAGDEVAPAGDHEWQLLGEFSIPSARGNERAAMDQVADALQAAPLAWQMPPPRLQRLKTAIAEATMNAMEHGNGFREELPVSIQLLTSPSAVAVRITDRRGSQPIPAVETPDLGAKLAGLQGPRGWGLFLIEKMVDEMHITSDNDHHTVELVLNQKGDHDGQFRF